MRTNSTAASQSGGPLPLTPASSSVQPAHLHLLTRGNHRLLRASGLLGFTDKKEEEEEEKRSPNPNHGSVDKVAVVVQLLPRSKCRLRRQVAAADGFLQWPVSVRCQGGLLLGLDAPFLGSLPASLRLNSQSSRDKMPAPSSLSARLQARRVRGAQ